MEELESWQKSGLTLDGWVAHVLRRAADRRELSEFETARGNVVAARLLMRSAIARELYAASLRGEYGVDEAGMLDALLPTWTGTSTEELLATARDILANDWVGA